MTALRDPEVLDLLQDEPELLALADAVASTQRRRRALPVRSLALGAAAAAAAILAIVLSGGGEPGITSRALAAIGSGPVIHVIVRHAEPFPAGANRAVVNETQTELWYDRVHKLLHVIIRKNGKLVSNVVETSKVAITATGVKGRTGAPRLDPTLADFATNYRADLASGRLRSDGRAVVAGRRVIWLRSARLRVAVDAKTFLPVLVERLRVLERGQMRIVGRVLKAETLQRDSANLRAPKRIRTHPRRP